jgi:methionine synthase II (cobalamin-independent)
VLEHNNQFKSRKIFWYKLSKVISLKNKKLDEKFSVIGSFPYLTRDIDQTIKSWLEVQRDTGVDYPCVQPDMVEMFLNDPNVNGVYPSNGRWTIDFGQLRVSGPVQHQYLKLIQQIAEEIDYKPHGFVIPVTGPFTLGERIVLPNTEMSLLHYPSLIEEFNKRVVIPIVKYYNQFFENCIIRIDEPTAQSGFLTGSGVGRFDLDSEFVKGIWLEILKEITSRNISGIHVCGDIRSVSIVLEDLAPRTILSHEFFTVDDPHGRNINCYDKKRLQRKDMMIGFGCVNSKSLNIESDRDIDLRMRKGVEKFGRENIHLNPACGFGGLASTGLTMTEIKKVISKKLSLVSYARNLKF